MQAASSASNTSLRRRWSGVCIDFRLKCAKASITASELGRWGEGVMVMQKSLVSEIHRRMGTRTTEELLQIWKKNDRKEWSDAAFEAVQLVLSERDVVIPPQVRNTQDAEEVRIINRLNMGHVALVCSVVGVIGHALILVSSPSRGLERVASQGAIEFNLMIAFILLAAVGLVVGLISLFKAVSRWLGLAAIAVTAAPLIYLMLHI